MARIGGLKRFKQGQKVKSPKVKTSIVKPSTGSKLLASNSPSVTYSNKAFSSNTFKPFSFLRDIAYNVVKDAGDTLLDLLYPPPESSIDRKVRVYKLKLDQERKQRVKLELKNNREKREKSKQVCKEKIKIR